MVERAGVARLKAALSEYPTRVKAGEEVVVIEWGRPIARIVPVKVERDPGRSKALERSGEIILCTGRLPEGFRSLKKLRDPEGRVRLAVPEECEEGW